MICYQERPAVIVLLGAFVNRAGKRLIKNFWPMPGFQRTYDVNKLTIKCCAEDMMMVSLRNQTYFTEFLFRANVEKMKLQKCIMTSTQSPSRKTQLCLVLPSNSRYFNTDNGAMNFE